MALWRGQPTGETERKRTACSLTLHMIRTGAPTARRTGQLYESKTCKQRTRFKQLERADEAPVHVRWCRACKRALVREILSTAAQGSAEYTLTRAGKRTLVYYSNR